VCAGGFAERLPTGGPGAATNRFRWKAIASAASLSLTQFDFRAALGGIQGKLIWIEPQRIGVATALLGQHGGASTGSIPSSLRGRVILPPHVSEPPAGNPCRAAVVRRIPY
jgi:hypothetical protein